MSQEIFEEELTALFAEVDAPPSVAGWRERIGRPESDLDAAPVVRPLRFEPKARRPVTPSQRVAAAAVAVLAIGFAIIGVVTSDRALSPPPRPDITQSMTDGPTTNSSALGPPPPPTVGFATSGQLPTSGQPATGSGGGGGGRAPAQGRQPPAAPGDTPVAPASGPLADWPDSSNTGVPPDTQLGTWTGDLHVTTPGAIVHDLRVDGTVFVEAPDVTLRRVLVAPHPGGPDVGVWQRPEAPRLRIEDSEISAVEVAHGVRQEAAGLTVQRSDLHTNGTALMLAVGDVTVVDSYLHSPGAQVESADGTARLTLRHNLINGAVDLHDESGPISDVLIDGNQLGGVLYLPSQAGSNGIRVLNNRFHRIAGGSSTTQSGWDGQAPGNTWTGNVWMDTSEPANP
jgi:hypothetical protein